MNETYDYRQCSETPRSIILLLSSLMATQPLATYGFSAQNIPSNLGGITQATYALKHSSSTAGEQNYLSSAYGDASASYDQEFTESISTFYSALYSKQQALGSDFEKVLNENLWDLYGS